MADIRRALLQQRLEAKRNFSPRSSLYVRRVVDSKVLSSGLECGKQRCNARPAVLLRSVNTLRINRG